MCRFAIRGHTTRGKDVINILKDFGGNNIIFQHKGNDPFYFYFIDENTLIQRDNSSNVISNYVCFLLEDFEKKYPYKVGDKVRLIDYNIVHEVFKIKWDNKLNRVIYDTKSDDGFESYFVAEELELYKEETRNEMLVPVKKIGSDEILYYVDKNNGDIKENKEIMEIKPTVTFEYIVDAKTGDLKLIVPENIEFIVNSNELILRDKKPKYPKTYAGCCEIIHSDPNFYVDTHLYSNKLESLYKLLICRDAYWKLAGEQIGLGKPWNQDYNDRCFIIANNDGIIHTYEYHGSNNVILAFPTKEMRDAFYENFKDLIEECKVFL